MGDWKLVSEEKGEAELHNLADDIGEKTDLFAANPARVKELQAAYDVWNAQLMRPRWGRGGSSVME